MPARNSKQLNGSFSWQQPSSLDFCNLQLDFCPLKKGYNTNIVLDYKLYKNICIYKNMIRFLNMCVYIYISICTYIHRNSAWLIFSEQFPLWNRNNQSRVVFGSPECPLRFTDDQTSDNLTMNVGAKWWQKLRDGNMSIVHLRSDFQEFCGPISPPFMSLLTLRPASQREGTGCMSTAWRRHSGHLVHPLVHRHPKPAFPFCQSRDAKERHLLTWRHSQTQIMQKPLFWSTNWWSIITYQFWGWKIKNRFIWQDNVWDAPPPSNRGK